MNKPDQTPIDLRHRLAASVEGATPAEKTIANYLLTNLRTLHFVHAVT